MSHEKISFHADLTEKEKEQGRLREEAAKLVVSAEQWEIRAKVVGERGESETKEKFLRWAQNDRKKAKNFLRKARRLEKN